MKVNYQEVRNAVRNRVDFKGNSCRGINTLTGYEIRSYQTMIYAINYETKQEYFNTDYFSTTTSKIQGIIAYEVFGRHLQAIRKEQEKELQKIDYKQLYYDKEIKISHSQLNFGSPIDLDIQIRGDNKVPDCKIGHFGYNLFYRTNAGINMKPYTTRARLEKAVENRLKREGFTVIKWIDKKL